MAAVYLILVINTLGFAILALIAEICGFSWLAIVFVIMVFLTWSAPKIYEIAKKNGYGEEREEEE